MPNPPTTPPGWRLVPVEPTEAMLRVGAGAIEDADLDDRVDEKPYWGAEWTPCAAKAWSAMLSAVVERPLNTTDVVYPETPFDDTQAAPHPPAEAEIVEKLREALEELLRLVRVPIDGSDQSYLTAAMERARTTLSETSTGDQGREG